MRGRRIFRHHCPGLFWFHGPRRMRFGWGWFSLIFMLPFLLLAFLFSPLGFLLLIIIAVAIYYLTRSKDNQQQATQPQQVVVSPYPAQVYAPEAAQQPIQVPTTPAPSYAISGSTTLSYCPYCGSKISSEYTYCPVCGKKIH